MSASFTSNNTNVPAVSGLHGAAGTGVRGFVEGRGIGVMGTSPQGVGVWAESAAGTALQVHCAAPDLPAIMVESDRYEAIHAVSHDERVATIAAYNAAGASPGVAVFASSKSGTAIHAQSDTGGDATVVAVNNGVGPGMFVRSIQHEGINAATNAPQHAAVAAYQTNQTSPAAALYAKKDGLVGHAGFFDGNVHVTGRIVAGVDICLANADCAEEFDICDAALPEPGTVMVLSDSGGLRTSERAYDKRVAGVVSGAGQYRPGIVLDSQSGQPNRQPIALLGKVYCKVDARYGPITVGDLLTTSDTPGHAMLAEDRAQAFGTVIGKALQPLPAGSGLIPILIALQ